jgi:hypothetical protein
MDTTYTIYTTHNMYDIHDTRYTIHDTRYTIHDTRYTIFMIYMIYTIHTIYMTRYMAQGKARYTVIHDTHDTVHSDAVHNTRNANILHSNKA